MEVKTKAQKITEARINGSINYKDEKFNASITLSQDVNIKPNGTIDIMAIEKAINYNNMNDVKNYLYNLYNILFFPSQIPQFVEKS